MIAAALLISDALLERRLEAVLGSPALVLQRTPNANQSTFPSETVLCRCADGREFRLHCKHSGGQSHAEYGHRGDLTREIAAYRDVVSLIGLPAPVYVGSFESASESILVLEHLEPVSRLDGARDPSAALAAAAAWAGEFHRVGQVAMEGALRAGLPAYDRRYYTSWLERTLALSQRWHDLLPWLQPLCSDAERIAGLLTGVAPATVIHGEYTPHNVLLHDGRVYPVDWESAAVAFGEIDLAGLVDKWPEDVEHACVTAYAAARWPDGPPPSFARRLDLARLYWDFRWLGDRPEWTGSEKVGPRFAHLEAVARRLDLIPEDRG